MLNFVFAREVDSAAFDWQPLDGVVEATEQTDEAVKVTTHDVTGEAILAAKPVVLPYGVYRLELDLAVQTGSVLVGVQDMLRNIWLNQIYVHAGGEGAVMLDFRPLATLGPVRVVLSAGNETQAGPVAFQLHTARIFKQAGLIGYVRAAVISFSQAIRGYYRVAVRPRLYLLRLALMRMWTPGAFRVLRISDIGQATRGIIVSKNEVGERYIVTADVGDDTLSVIRFNGNQERPRGVLFFPVRSAPMYLLPWRRSGRADVPVVFTFNFDEMGQTCPMSQVLAFPGIDAVGPGERHEIGEIATKSVASRAGAWGYRGGAFGTDRQGRRWFAFVDREKSLFHVMPEDRLDAKENGESASVDLPGHFEPIGVTSIDDLPGTSMPVFVVNSRHQERLITVTLSENGTPTIGQIVEIDGRSRSSVVFGKFSADKPLGQIAIALWGGDPENLNTIDAGQVLLMDVTEEGAIESPQYVQAGIHPTDVAVGDLDGDGLQELVVLNYGNGLGPGDRVVPGGVGIYKYLDGTMRCFSRIGLPSPRIACCADLDDDGVDELLISLFFERKLVTLKHKSGHSISLAK